MENIEKRKKEFDNLMQNYNKTVGKIWVQISEIEKNNTLKPNEKEAKIKDTIMKGVSNYDN
ncbi:MAG: hypothetical protein PHC34_07135 [Candidatus Gastranaerophilales bacterium]|nr:hypothetical protein [Candidatus Gastranaerophilales bacterium]